MNKQYEFGRFHGLRMWWRWSASADGVRFVLFTLMFLSTIVGLGALVMGFVALGVLLFGEPMLPTAQQAWTACGLIVVGFVTSVTGSTAMFKLTS